MKAIFHIVAIVAACGAAFFSFSLSSKFKAAEEQLQTTNTENTEVTSKADGAEKEIKDLKGKLASTEERRDLLTQSVDSLKSETSSLQNELKKLDAEIKVQDGEFAELQKTLEQVNAALADIGGGVTLDTLPETIQQLEEKRDDQQKKVENLETLIAGAEKSLSNSRAELDRLGKRSVERNARISRNSTEAVVTAVNQDWGFLVIGAGSNSGFTPQAPLLIERDGRNIGRVRPSSVEPTQTIAEIDLKSLSAGVRIQPGDRVILSKPAAN
ncbi:MAG: hypothetical protein EOP88_16765 [Verrucomicrobiaceae bacterium]|nr:MAG: hypothetical protein EOP88_16765 [Verrucomicrobiaceae bacterium]